MHKRRTSMVLISSLAMLATAGACTYDAGKLRTASDAADLGPSSSTAMDAAGASDRGALGAGGALAVEAGGFQAIGAGGVVGTTTISKDAAATDASTGAAPEVIRSDAASVGVPGTGGIGGTTGSPSTTVHASGGASGLGGTTIANAGGVAGTGGFATSGSGGVPTSGGGATAARDASAGGAGGTSESSGKGGPHTTGGTGDPGKGPHGDVDGGSSPDGGDKDGAACTKPPADFGKPCGKCGGAITCAGACSVPTPANYGAACVSLTCLCQLTGVIDCQGDCVCNC
jgi:hypothetical protein